ncbi:Endoribonuclease L-PSP [Phytophthora nicotianae]|uniref:Endoribonuclease L-PSP n=1 Tax=Phytophthora nicotianae TaxID=4792 RepID=A0A0W8CH91_PHYNI|nr:Endoribonuclease L-PSP [Phytophthora nicotianae]
MRNLPDLDSFGLAGLETDAYVEALIGDNVRTSGVVWNSLNPKWPPCTEAGCAGEDDLVRDLNFGFRPAGTEIIVRVWDKDSGFEFGDDLVAQVTLNAIYCSAFSALKQKLPSNDTSTWALAEQPMCVEELWIPLTESGDCTDAKTSAPCMRIRMTAVPFQMRTEEVFVSGALVNGGMGGYFPDEESWLYGRVYSSSDTRLLSYYRMADSQGGLLIRSSSTSNNNKGNTSLISTYGYAPYSRVTFNFAAQLFVFRRVDDEASSPEWLNTTFGWVETREYAQLMNVAGDFKAVAQNFTPHAINKYGDAEGRGVITGANVALNYTDTTLSMYFIVAVPHETLDVVPAVYSKEFSRGIFLEITVQYGPTFAFLMILVVRYLRRMHWRVERVQSFLAEKVANPSGQLSAAAGVQPKVKEKNNTAKGKEKIVKKTKVKKPDIVAQLFFCYGDGENNAQFRRNLCYATWAVNIVIASPVLMLLSWGVTSIVLVTPPAFGFGIVFLGIGALGGIYAASVWVRTGWRMTRRTLYLFAVAFFGAFVFLFSATFADPKVYVGGEDLDFFSLSCIFLTLNMMPIIWLAFTNDSKLSKSLKQVIAVVGASKKVTTLKSKFKNLGTLGLKLATAKSDHQVVDPEESKTKRKRKESPFAAILGDHYTVEQSLPGLEYADILKSVFVTPASTRRRVNRRCYWSVLATLVVYCIVASAWTEYGTQAVGISITLVLVDLLVLLAFAGVTAHLCAVTPVQMGIAAKYVNEMILKDASEAAQAVANRRSQPFTLESPEFVEQERREKKAELEFQAIAYGGGAASAFASRKKGTKAVDIKVEEEVVKVEPRLTCGDIALDIEDVDRQCRYITTTHGLEVCRPDGLLSWKEVKQDIFQRGVGPFGFLYAFTVPPRVFRFLRWKYFPATLKWRRKAKSDTQADRQADTLERGDCRIDTTPADPSRDLVELLLRLPELDAALDRAFYEETRCVIHLQLLMLTASDARLSREKILFQKFLRENRFKLMSNGISPPANVFRTSSFASIDIPLVAVWLLSLTPESRARFHALKAAFNEEMERTDAIVDAEDRAALVAQKELQEHWAPREAEQCRQRMQEFLARRLRRESEGILTEEEDSKPGYDEGLVNAKEALLEIESGYSCVPGEYGRSLQFVDREFPPDTTSLTGCSHESEVAPQWKVSSAINIASGLFDGGTDPDDVRVGRLDDAWLLSALSIMAASGGVDDGKVDELIDRLFVTKQTSLTGAYALRLYQNCQWETVVVDDYFPVLYESAGDEAELSVSAGAAFAHSRDFEELWVPLVEKAFAKYYGGYAALERGYVHHALRVLSGCECEEVFLAPAARGALKKTLWQQLKLFRKNQFLLGAASLPSEHADPALRASGLVFDACYVIYDVRDVDGAQLLKLRNPPGDHEEWKGDWSDSSRLWTRRLRKRLGVRKGEDTGEDNTFWMSFDDFCHAFRALYVCRYYDPDKWTVKTLDTRFSREDATSSGLPTRHNPGCTGLDNNPHFSLRVSRPTEVIVTVTQVDSRGMAPVAVLPIAVYIVAHQDQKDRARRVTALNQDNVTVHSGVPARNREVRIQCELAARTYTLLVAAYVSGMEGPFRLHVQSNYPVELQQIWPAAWKTGNGTMTPVPHGTLVERMAEKMKHTVTESAAGTKIMAKTHELADKIAAGAAIVDNVMRDEESILEEQLAKQQQEEADEAEKKETRLTGKKKKKTDPDAPQSNPWIEQWDEGAGKPFYFNKQTGMSSWEKPDDF